MYVFMAMEVNEGNLDFISRYETTDMKENLAWIVPLYDLSTAQGVNYYIVATHRYDDVSRIFTQESLTILDASVFMRKYVFVMEGRPGFQHAVKTEA